MQNSTFRSLVVLALLVAGIVVAYFSSQFGPIPGQANTGEFLYVADIDYWQRTGRERFVNAKFPIDLGHSLAEAVPLTIGEWVGNDVPQSNIGVFLVLEPEQYVERLYRNPEGQYIWLTLIGGRSSRSFHAPESCYSSYGWQTRLVSQDFTLSEGGEIYGMLITAEKAGIQQLSYYLYLFPDRSRTPTDGIVIFRLTSPVHDSLEATVDLLGQFVRLFFTETKTTGAL